MATVLACGTKIFFGAVNSMQWNSIFYEPNTKEVKHWHGYILHNVTYYAHTWMWSYCSLVQYLNNTFLCLCFCFQEAHFRNLNGQYRIFLWFIVSGSFVQWCIQPYSSNSSVNPSSKRTQNFASPAVKLLFFYTFIWLASSELRLSHLPRIIT